MDKNQKDYLLREQMQVIREELGESNTETDAQEYEKKLQELQASREVKARIHKEIERFQGISGNSSESTVSRGYIETLLELPWDAVSEDNKDLKHAQKILDEDHYGLEKVKERILEFLAVRNLTGKGESRLFVWWGLREPEKPALRVRLPVRWIKNMFVFHSEVCGMKRRSADTAEPMWEQCREESSMDCGWRESKIH